MAPWADVQPAVYGKPSGGSHRESSAMSMLQLKNNLPSAIAPPVGPTPMGTYSKKVYATPKASKAFRQADSSASYVASKPEHAKYFLNRSSDYQDRRPWNAGSIKKCCSEGCPCEDPLIPGRKCWPRPPKEEKPPKKRDPDPEIQYKTVIKYVDRPVVKYVDRPVTHYVDREVIKYVDRVVEAKPEKPKQPAAETIQVPDPGPFVPLWRKPKKKRRKPKQQTYDNCCNNCCDDGGSGGINEMLHGTGFQNHARQYDDYLKEYYDWCMRYHGRLPQGNMSHGGNYAGWTPYY
jgi:hypothetical protein